MSTSKKKKRINDPGSTSVIKRIKTERAKPYERFDLNVRALCFDLQSKNNHLIFGALGIIDLIVEFARPIVPLYAPMPDALFEFMQSPQPNDPSYSPHVGLDSPWVFQDSRFLGDIPVGSVFSCPMLGSTESVDCIVVVPASTLYPGPVHQLRFASKWVVGVIVPSVVRSHKPADGISRYSFGADRTIFMDQLGSGAPPLEALVPPSNHLYAVHYVDVHMRHKGYWDSTAQRFRVRAASVFTLNKACNLFPHYDKSTRTEDQVHLLPNEIGYWEAEDTLLSK